MHIDTSKEILELESKVTVLLNHFEEEVEKIKKLHKKIPMDSMPIQVCYDEGVYFQFDSVDDLIKNGNKAAYVALLKGLCKIKRISSFEASEQQRISNLTRLHNLDNISLKCGGWEGFLKKKHNGFQIIFQGIDNIDEIVLSQKNNLLRPIDIKNLSIVGLKYSKIDKFNDVNFTVTLEDLLYNTYQKMCREIEDIAEKIFDLD
jgi:hypothetical protein